GVQELLLPLHFTFATRSSPLRVTRLRRQKRVCVKAAKASSGPRPTVIDRRIRYGVTFRRCVIDHPCLPLKSLSAESDGAKRSASSNRLRTARPCTKPRAIDASRR